MLSRKIGMEEPEVLRHAKVLVRTLGKDGAEIFTEDRRFEIPVFPTETVLDPTGVGDAFRAGLLTGMTLHWPWDVTGRAASLCAAYALEQVGTQNHRYTAEGFIARYRTAFDDGGILDSLPRRSESAPAV
jgi:adenosine kinase